MKTQKNYSTTFSFLDLLFNTLLAFVAFFALSLLMIKNEVSKAQIESKAEFVISIEWATESVDDIDLYVEDPNQKLVCFRRLQDGLMHLERDDLGYNSDIVDLPDGTRFIYKENKEMVYLRGIIPGEYTVNVHMYGKRHAEPALVFGKLEKLNPHSTAVVNKVLLEEQAQEKTVFRFTIDAEGNVTSCDTTLQKTLANVWADELTESYSPPQD